MTAPSGTLIRADEAGRPVPGNACLTPDAHRGSHTSRREGWTTAEISLCSARPAAQCAWRS